MYSSSYSNPAIYKFGDSVQTTPASDQSETKIILDSREVIYRNLETADFTFAVATPFVLSPKKRYSIYLTHFECRLRHNECFEAGEEQKQKFLELTWHFYMVSKALCLENIINNRRLPILSPITYRPDTESVSGVDYRGSLNVKSLLNTSLIDISLTDHLGTSLSKEFIELDPKKAGEL